MNYCLSAPGSVYVVGASPVDGNDQTTDDDKILPRAGYVLRGSPGFRRGGGGMVGVPHFNNDLVRQTLLSVRRRTSVRPASTPCRLGR